MVRRSRLVGYSSKKSFVFRHASASRLQDTHFSVKHSEDPCRKNDISRSFWPKSFILTVKDSFFSQRIVYESFYGASFAFSYFFFKKKFVLEHGSASRLRKVYLCEAFWRSLSKKLYLQFYLTQIVHSNGKIFFLWPKNCLSKLLWRVVHIYLVIPQGKVLCFSTRRQVAYEMFISVERSSQNMENSFSLCGKLSSHWK